MASSLADSNQMDGTKCFMHEVNSNGDRAIRMFDVSSIVEPLEVYGDSAHYVTIA